MVIGLACCCYYTGCDNADATTGADAVTPTTDEYTDATTDGTTDATTDDTPYVAHTTNTTTDGNTWTVLHQTHISFKIELPNTGI